MPVAIDELVSEVPDAPAASPAAAPPRTSPPVDMDRLDYETARRRHRVLRLWAD